MSSLKDTKYFINKAKQIHNNKYDYSKSNYIKSSEKLEIICPIHGSFWQRANRHLQGDGCPYCGGTKKLTTEEFIKKAQKVHNNKYDYSESEYINNSKPLKIICPTHGDFWQIPYHHLEGVGCPKCYGNKKLTTEEFIKKARVIHGNKYDYSESEYIGNNKKLTIKCNSCGNIFEQEPNNHLSDHGCPYCLHKISRQEKFIAELIQKFIEEKKLDVKFWFEQKYKLEQRSIKNYVLDLDIFIEKPFKIGNNIYKGIGIQVEGPWHYEKSLLTWETFNNDALRHNESNIVIFNIEVYNFTAKERKRLEKECEKIFKNIEALINCSSNSEFIIKENKENFIKRHNEIKENCGF